VNINGFKFVFQCAGLENVDYELALQYLNSKAFLLWWRGNLYKDSTPPPHACKG